MSGIGIFELLILVVLLMFGLGVRGTLTFLLVLFLQKKGRPADESKPKDD